MELVLLTVYSLCLALPISIFIGFGCMVVGLTILRATGQDNVIDSLSGLAVVNLSILAGISGFLLLFAHFVRNL